MSIWCLARSGFLMKNVGLRSSSTMIITKLHDLQLPDEIPKDIEYPEQRKLKIMEKVPPALNSRLEKMPKQLIHLRGPEEVHTFLLHKQFGIRALGGGQLKHGHFEMIRNTINKKLDETRCFAIWRVDPPWKPITKKGQGHRMGGGKGNIDHFVTPVRSGRIVVEFGGKIGYTEAYAILRIAAEKLPFSADVVSQESLEKEIKLQELLERTNLNPFSFKDCVQNNLFGCRKWVSPYDERWFGKYR